MPTFVLDELQQIADTRTSCAGIVAGEGWRCSSGSRRDAHAGGGGRRRSARRSPRWTPARRLAKRRSRSILTNDFNLNRVAELQGVRVLNINSLANAMKPAVLPGEELRVRVIQEGKEAGQGVGFLDDGTMIVVEGGARLIDREVEVTVTRVLQTVAGRMIFAQQRVDEGFGGTGGRSPTLSWSPPAPSRRMAGTDKLAWPIAGRPLLHWTLAALRAAACVDRLVLVTAPGRVDEITADPYDRAA